MLSDVNWLIKFDPDFNSLLDTLDVSFKRIHVMCGQCCYGTIKFPFSTTKICRRILCSDCFLNPLTLFHNFLRSFLIFASWPTYFFTVHTKNEIKYSKTFLYFIALMVASFVFCYTFSLLILLFLSLNTEWNNFLSIYHFNQCLS